MKYIGYCRATFGLMRAIILGWVGLGESVVIYKTLGFGFGIVWVVQYAKKGQIFFEICPRCLGYA